MPDMYRYAMQHLIEKLENNVFDSPTIAQIHYTCTEFKLKHGVRMCEVPCNNSDLTLLITDCNTDSDFCIKKHNGSN